MKALPKAKKVKKVLKKHNDSRIDNYYWLRDDTRKNKAVLDYLKTERAIMMIGSKLKQIFLKITSRNLMVTFLLKMSL